MLYIDIYFFAILNPNRLLTIQFSPQAVIPMIQPLEFVIYTLCISNYINKEARLK